LKVILSVDAISPPLSGIGRYTWELARRIGHVPSVEQVRYHRNDRWVNELECLLKPRSTLRRSRFKPPRWLRELYWRRACQRHIFHGPNYFLPPYAQNGVVTVHDLSVFKFPETHPQERVTQFERLFRKTLNIATHLITDSRTTRLEVIDFLGWPADRITSVHLGVASCFTPRSAEVSSPTLKRYGLRPKHYSLCVSTIEPRKRIDALLESFSQLPGSLRAQYPLVLVGAKGWRSEHLHGRIEKAQEAGWLRYLGFVPEADLPMLYAGARLFAYPSIYEGFGLPVAEAMACGVPVVTSNRSCLPEVVAGAAMLVDPDDIDALTIALEQGLLDSQWREQAIARGLHVAAKYDWTECVKQTVAVYGDYL
jgi:glycosyltransferase involved in cell wall biosynthesis